MNRKIIWLVVSGLMVVALLVAACAPAPQKEAAPVVKEAAPAVREAAPAVREAAPAAGKETVTFTLTKIDGTKITRTVEKPQYGGTIVSGPGAANEGFDDARLPHWTTLAMVGIVYEELLVGDWRRGLSGTGETGWSIPGWIDMDYMTGQLAESWEIEGPTTIVYHLRKGIRWQNKPPVNGRELVAADAVFALRRIMFDIPTAPQLVGPAKPVDIYARDKYTLVVEAPKGQTGYTWEYVSQWMRIYPPEVAKVAGAYEDWRNVVGTGPWIITDYVPQSSLTYTKNPNYWMTDPIYGADYPIPYIDTIRQLRIPDKSTEMAALRTGKLDYTNSDRELEEWQSLMKTTPRLLWIKGIYSSHKPIGLRLDNPALPWAGPNGLNVRRALQMSMDNEGWVRDLYKGEGIEMSFYVGPFKEYAASRTEPQDLPRSADGFDNRKLYCNTKIGITPEQNIAEAKQLLAKAGYPNGFKAEIIAEATWADDLSLIKANWAKIGVDLEIKIVTSAVRESVKQKSTHTQMIQHSGTMSLLYNMMHFQADNPYYNVSFVNDPYLTDAYNKMTALYFNMGEKSKIMKDVHLYAIDKVYYLILPVPYQYRVWQPWLKNYNGAKELGFMEYPDFLQYAWIDQKLKESLLK